MKLGNVVMSKDNFLMWNLIPGNSIETNLYFHPFWNSYQMCLVLFYKDFIYSGTQLNFSN